MRYVCFPVFWSQRYTPLVFELRCVILSLLRVPTVGQFCFSVSTSNGIGPTANLYVHLTKGKLCHSGNVRQIAIELTIKFIIAIL